MIGFCDLKQEHMESRDELLRIFAAAIEDSDFCNGKAVKAFEKAFADYLGFGRVCAVSNGTDALFLALKALGIGQGDEVIIPANTFVSTAWAAVYNGATPVFCDCMPDTWEMNPESVAAKITPRTKAIAAVHLYGQAVDFDAVRHLADENGLYIVEDCAQSHGALYKGKKTGTLGDIGCFSFYPTKNLGAMGDAGAVVTKDEAAAALIDSLKFHAFDKSTGDHSQIGYNMRMDSIQAAVLTYKLGFLEQKNAVRRQIAGLYGREITNPYITAQKVADDCQSVWYLYMVKVNDRQRFMQHMHRHGIACGIHYPVPCHLQGAFRYLGYEAGSLPLCEDLAAHCVSLPMYPELTPLQTEQVIHACNCYTG